MREALILPELGSAEITFYHLTGEYQWPAENLADRANWPIFRETPILSSFQLESDLEGEIVEILGNPDSYGGEPMRCFIPRHGLQIRTQREVVDLLICLECHIIKSWVGESANSHTITAATVESLGGLFPPKASA